MAVKIKWLNFRNIFGNVLLPQKYWIAHHEFLWNNEKTSLCPATAWRQDWFPTLWPVSWLALEGEGPRPGPWQSCQLQWPAGRGPGAHPDAWSSSWKGRVAEIRSFEPFLCFLFSCSFSSLASKKFVLIKVFIDLYNIKAEINFRDSTWDVIDYECMDNCLNIFNMLCSDIWWKLSFIFLWK